MKVAVGFRVEDRPWGGGNRFAAALVAELSARGDRVCHTLDEDDIDVILMMDPRWRHPSVTFTPGAILRYLLFTNRQALVVHRINECDERKQTRHMNSLLRRANYCADHTVFVGSWLRQLDLWQDGPDAKSSVITNGADAVVFNPRGWQPWSGLGPLKLVTHHWGGNWMKGFDIYQRIDRMLAEPSRREKLEFTYIGNLPAGFRFQNARHVQPLNGSVLATEIKKHHVYITASINEPGGNHQNEAGACGLPLLYRRSGCLPEYCDGFGISFDEYDFESALDKMFVEYHNLIHVMADWPHLSTRTCAEYISLFESLVQNRENIVGNRQLWRNPWLILRNQVSI